MDPKARIPGTLRSEPPSTDEERQRHLATLPFAAASLSFCLFVPKTLPTHFFKNPRISDFIPCNRSKVQTTRRATFVSHLCVSSSSSHLLSSSKSSIRSTFSANPLQTPLSLGPRRPSDPSNVAGIRRSCIVWFRNDLRVDDNECLNSANEDSLSVLPVYCFDPRDYGKSSSGFSKTGPYRASFLIESISDLRKNLQAKGSDLVVRVGNPENVLVELAKSIGADALYAHREVSQNEVKVEEKIEEAMKGEGVEVKHFWGSTLHHVDDLPFTLEAMPLSYSVFKEKVRGTEIRNMIPAPNQLKGLPSRDVESGKIPSLLDLGLNITTDEKRSSSDSAVVGGETEGTQKLKKFAAECKTQPPKVTNGKEDGIYGANFSCKISPWLAFGCISPRSMFAELKGTATSEGVNGLSNSGNSWLMYELLWRDFFRFVTKKYSSPTKQLQSTPDAALAGALA